MKVKGLLIVGLSVLALVQGLARKRARRPNWAVADGKVVDLNSFEEVMPSQERAGAEPSATPWYAEDYKALTQGLTEIDLTYKGASRVILFGEKAFPVATNLAGDVFIGALNLGTGKGRVIVMGREEWCYDTSAPKSMQTFVTNAITWLAQKTAGIKTATNQAFNLFGQQTQQKVEPSQLATVKPDVYMIDSKEEYTDEDANNILAFVNSGGGLLIAGQSWYKGSTNMVETFNSNHKITIKFGMFIYGGGYQQTFNVASMPVPEHNVFHAISLYYNEPPSNVANDVTNRNFRECFTEYTKKLPEFEPLIQNLEKRFQSFDAKENVVGFSKINCNMLPKILSKIPKALKKASNADTFPGAVPAGAPRVTKTLTMKANYTKPQPSQFFYSGAYTNLMLSTGLYAAPGEIVRVKIPAVPQATAATKSRITVQIGAHTDWLYRKVTDGQKPLRSPEVVLRYPITGEVTVAGSPWGGLVYITVPRGANVGDIEVIIENVVEAPRFIQGIHTNSDWNSKIKNLQGPWVEFEVPGQYIMTLPRDKVMAIENLDPEKVMSRWKDTFAGVNKLAGLTERARPERFCLDIEISHGWMHSGYPIMGPVDATAELLFAKANKAAWGPIHELGHNHQWQSWTIGRTTETGCNWWSTYVHEKVYNISAASAHSARKPEAIDSRIYEWLMNGRPAESWKVWLALDTYTFLADVYGWEPFMKLDKKYYSMPLIQSDEEKLDTWARLFSQEVNKNLCPFFQWWKFPLTKETLDICSGLPKPDKNPIEKYEKFLASVPTSHGKCLDGWYAYGTSCFFFSKENKNWWDAEIKCAAVNNSHLASCLTEPEGFYLAKLLDQNKDSSAYTIGLSEMNADGTYRFMDYSEPSNLPWADGLPKKGSKDQCAFFQNKALREGDCTEPRQFICKQTAANCKPDVKCPEGWTPWDDRCFKFDPTMMTFDQAAAKCKTMDPEATLVEVQSMQEHWFLRAMSDRLQSSGKSSYWTAYFIGVKDVQGLTWESGSSIDLNSVWCEGHPKNVGGSRVAMWRTCWEEWSPEQLGYKKAGVICQRPGIFGGP